MGSLPVGSSFIRSKNSWSGSRIGTEVVWSLLLMCFAEGHGAGSVSVSAVYADAETCRAPGSYAWWRVSSWLPGGKGYLRGSAMCSSGDLLKWMLLHSIVHFFTAGVILTVYFEVFCRCLDAYQLHHLIVLVYIVDSTVHFLAIRVAIISWTHLCCLMATSSRQGKKTSERGFISVGSIFFLQAKKIPFCRIHLGDRPLEVCIMSK